MPLQFQLTQMPFQVGLQEGLDPRLAPLGTLTTAENVRWSKTGRLEKRYGTTPLTTNTRIPTESSYTTGAIASGYRLGVRGKELFLIDGHYLHSWSPSLNTWTRRDRVPDLGIEWKKITTLSKNVGGNPSSWKLANYAPATPPSFSVTGNVMCLAWVESYTSQYFTSQTTPSLVYAIIDISTGALLQPKTVIQDVGDIGGAERPKVVSYNGAFHVYYKEGSSTAVPVQQKMYVASISAATYLQIGAPFFLNTFGTTTAELNGFDVSVARYYDSSTELSFEFLIFAVAKLQGQIEISKRTWDPIIGMSSDASANTVKSYINTPSPTDFLGDISIFQESQNPAFLEAGDIQIVFQRQLNFDLALFFTSVEPGGLTQVAPISQVGALPSGSSVRFLDFFVASAPPTYGQYAIVATWYSVDVYEPQTFPLTTTSVHYTYTGASMSLANALTTPTTRIPNVCINSKPFVVDGKTYSVISDSTRICNGQSNTEDVHVFSTHVVDVTKSDFVPVGALSPNGFLQSPLHAHKIDVSATLRALSGTGCKASTPYVSGNDAYFVTASIEGGITFAKVSVGKSVPSMWCNVTYNQEAYVGGGVLTAFDGQSCFDFGFSRIAGFADVNRSLNNPYLVQCVNEYTSAAGILHRSAPSYAVLSLLDGQLPVPASTDAKWLAQGISSKRRGGTALSLLSKYVKYKLYLSKANSSTVYQASVEDSVSSLSYGGWTSDTATPVPALGTIYTAGGILDDEQPPSLTTICLHKDRIWGVDGSGNQVWFSKSFLDDYGVAPGFSSQFRIQFSKKVTALASLDEKLIAFGEDTLWYLLGGDGVTPDGLKSDLQGPFSIQSDVGCTNPRSVVSTPDGVMFQSARGIYLLTRGLELAWIGRPVKDKLAAYPVITSAVLVAAHNEVRFTANNAAGNAGIVLVYNYVEKQWTTYQYAGFGYPSYAPIADAIVWNGVYTFVTPNGQVYQEDTSTHIDASFYWVPMTIETSWVSATGPIAFQSVRSVQLVGTSHSDHSLTVSIGFDGNAAYQQVKTWPEGSPVTAVGDLEQAAIAVTNRRKCQMLRVKIQDGTPIATLPYGTGKGPSFDALGLETGVKRGFAPTPATKKG